MTDGSPAERLGRVSKDLVKTLPGIRTLDQQRTAFAARVDQLERELAEQEAEAARLERELAQERAQSEDLRRRAGFVPPGHFYSAQPSLEEFERDHDRIYAVGRRPTVAGVELNDEGHRELLEAFGELYPDLPFPHEPSDERRYHYDNGVFGYADAIFLYSVLRHFRPRRVVEVGSGFSSAAMLDTSELFLDDALELTLVEPYTDRLKSLLRPGDERRMTLIEQRVQDVPLETYDMLERDDVLFIDSTHVSKIGSDVNHLVFEVLPTLKPGVLVHIHDIGYPFEYPAAWVRDGRAWNEAYLVRAFLEFNDRFEVVFFCSYAQQFHEDWLSANMPLTLTGGGGSLWIRRTEAPTAR